MDPRAAMHPTRERERQMAQTGVQETRGKTWGFEQRELYETEFIGT